MYGEACGDVPVTLLRRKGVVKLVSTAPADSSSPGKGDVASSALMVNSMVQCNLILAAILKNGKTYVSEAEEEEFMFRCCKYAYHYEHGCRPPYPKRTFQRMWERRY